MDEPGKRDAELKGARHKGPPVLPCHLHKNVQNWQTRGNKVDHWLPGAGGAGGNIEYRNGYGVSFWGDESRSKLIMVMATQLYEYTKTQ